MQAYLYLQLLPEELQCVQFEIRFSALTPCSLAAASLSQAFPPAILSSIRAAAQGVMDHLIDFFGSAIKF